jgi:alanine dehydrogenase
MHIGVPKEIKNHEYRVALTPVGARALTEAGHRVSIEAGAGTAAGFGDDA